MQASGCYMMLMKAQSPPPPPLPGPPKSKAHLRLIERSKAQLSNDVPSLLSKAVQGFHKAGTGAKHLLLLIQGQAQHAQQGRPMPLPRRLPRRLLQQLLRSMHIPGVQRPEEG